jgi:predicted phage-related endonuclease
MRKIRGGEFPDRWYCQMVHYMSVTGLERAYLAVLINCREIRIFTLERTRPR